MQLAKRRSRCPQCRGDIAVGAPIGRLSAGRGGWGCAICAADDGADAIVADKEMNVCRHWRERGICRRGSDCAFLHPPALARKVQIVIGLGTGRCGTLSLARLLDRQPNARVQHEPEVDNALFEWEAPAVKRAQCVSRQLDEFRKWGRPLVGAVHYVYLPYARDYIAQDPSVKFVVLKRPRHEVVASYLRKVGGCNHWQPRADGKQPTRWERTYPTFCDPGLSKAEAIGMYWDLYAAEVAVLCQAYPQSVRCYSHEAVLNDAATQEEMLSWLGVDQPNLVVGEVHNRSQLFCPSCSLPSTSTVESVEVEDADHVRQRRLVKLGLTPRPEPEPYQCSGSSRESNVSEIVPSPGESKYSVVLCDREPPLQRRRVARDNFQHYSSAEAWRRWHTRAALRHVDYTLGYPIVVSDAAPDPTPNGVVSDATLGMNAEELSELERWLLQAGDHIHPSIEKKARSSGIAGKGVFTHGEISAGTLVGAYCGTIRTEEEWEERYSDSNFSVVVNGARSPVYSQMYQSSHLSSVPRRRCNRSCNRWRSG